MTADSYKTSLPVRAVVAALLMTVTVLTSCAADDDSGSESGSEKSDHVFKEQAQAIDKAREVQRMLDESRK
jgi:hypothetical protein